MPHEEWCDLLSPMEAKDCRKRAAAQIKTCVASKADTSSSDSNTSTNVLIKKKVKTGVLLDHRQQSNKKTE